MMKRRGFLLGLSAALAAPAIVRAGNIMRVAQLKSVTTQGIYIAPSDALGTSGAWVSDPDFKGATYWLNGNGIYILQDGNAFVLASSVT
jgi:hypothetical protein